MTMFMVMDCTMTFAVEQFIKMQLEKTILES